MIVDAHNDLLLELVRRSEEERPFERYWLGALEAGGVGLQVCPTFVGEEHLLQATPCALLQAAAFHRALWECPDRVVQVRARADLDRLDGRVGLMLSMEGVEPLGYDPGLIDVFWALGVRMVSLTWNRRNAFADGLAEPEGGGLSRLGERLVDRLAELGAILDLAHASERTFEGVLERAGEATVVVSHAGCRAVCETPRNLADGQLHALAERGGVLGIMALPLTVDPEAPTLERLVDHVDHAVSVMGIEHVGLGADFIHQVARAEGAQDTRNTLMPPGMKLDAVVEGLEGPADYPSLVEALRRRGYDGARLDAILGGNFLRLFRAALPG